MKKMNVAGLGLLMCCVGIQSQASLVYEGFDYTSGDTISAVTGTGDGWSGNWSTTTSGNGVPTVTSAGLSFDGALAPTGNAVQRSTYLQKGEMHRSVSASGLTADDSTMWFSVLMNPGSVTSAFATSVYGTLVFGDTALGTGLDSKSPSIGSGGNAIGVGFAGAPIAADFSGIRVQGVTYENGSVSQNTGEIITTGDTTVMIVGMVEWAANGENDTIKLYNISDLSAGLKPEDLFSTMSADFDQSTFSIVSIGDSQASMFDEIRMDTELANVIPEPATLGLVAAFGAGILMVRRRFMF